jgi:hypothetical protein
MEQLGRPSKLIVLKGVDHAFSVFKYGPDQSVRRAILEIDNFLVTRGWLHGIHGLAGQLDVVPLLTE